MKLHLVIAVIVVIAILLISSSVYIIYFYNGDGNNDNGNGNNGGGNGNNSGDIDDEPPTVKVITQDATGKKGDTITVLVTFSDNIDVTNATLYYRSVDNVNWVSKNIISGSYDISLDSNENIFYYVTVDDAAGNGPVGDPSTDGSDYYTITVKEQNNGNNGYTRKVLVEESTASTCKYCTNVAEVLHELFDQENPEFYYISMVDDKNDLANKRVVDYYNRANNPTVFIDGGYEVIYGFDTEPGVFKADFKQKVKNSLLREVPELILEINSEWNESRKELTTRVNIDNRDSNTYTGELKVFISEIKSTRWNDYNGDAFHYAFLEYTIEENIELDPDENKEFSSIWLGSESKYSDVVPENLMVFAVVHNSESTKKYSDPPPLGENKNQFDAYYSDAVEATRVQEGSLPPTIGITSPKKGYRYYFGQFNNMPPLRAIMVYGIRQLRNGTSPLINRTLIGKTILYGRNQINVTIDAPAGVKKVEFYADDELNYNTSEEPYEWSFSKIGQKKQIYKKHTIRVKVIDNQDRSAEDSIEIIAIFL